MPIGYPVYPLYLSENVGCGYVQPAIGRSICSACAGSRRPRDGDVASPATACARGDRLPTVRRARPVIGRPPSSR